MGLTRGIEGICLMGETSGYLVDPKSAASLLRVITTLLEIEIDPTLLEQRAEEMGYMLQKLVDVERVSQDDELRYFV
jgi:proteasome assembly chaperone (PAC2) family protein